jgi:hypothetical protein
LAAIDPRRPPATTALPEPIPEDSAILSRRTVPARASLTPATTASATIGAAIPAAATEGRLTVRRLGSSIAPPPAETVRAAAPSAPAMAAPAALLPSDEDVDAAFDPDDDTAIGPPSSILRGRRGPRTPAYRALRKPSTVRSSVPPPEMTGAEPTQPPALPRMPSVIPELPPRIPTPRPASRPPIAPPTSAARDDELTAPPELPQIARPAAAAPIRPATPLPHAPPPAAPPVWPPNPPPSSRPRHGDLDEDFARLRAAETEEYSSDTRTRPWSIMLGFAAVLMIGLFVVWIARGGKKPALPEQSAIAETSPPVTVPAWPTIPEEDDPLAIGSTTAATASVAAAPPAPDHSAEIATHLETGTQALQRERYGDAKKAFDAILALEEGHVAARAGLAHALYGLGNDNAASREARRALEVEGSNARAHLVLGFVATGQGREKEAEAEYRRYLELEPDGPFAAEIRSFLKSQR